MQKRGFNKKAQMTHQVYFILIQLVLIIMVLAGLLVFINNVKNNVSFEKNFLSRDIGLLTTTLYASPGSVYYSYNITSFEFIFEFSDNRLSVREKEKAIPKKYWYIDNKNILLFDDLQGEKTNRIDFLKTDSELRIAKEIEPKLNLKSCPEIQTKDDMTKKIIIIDPAKGCNKDIQTGECLEGKGTLGHENKGIVESTQLRLIAGLLTDKSENIISTRNPNEEEYKTEQERLSFANEKNADLFIRLQIGEYNKDENILKAYTTDNEKSVKLACLIINSLTKQTKIENTIIIQSEENILKNNAAVPVIIELGSIKNPEIIKKPSIIANAIYRAIEDYYE